MKPENRQIFEENRKHYDTLVNAGYMVHLSGGDRSNLVKAMSEEFQPGYSADLWCPPCVSNMMHQVYRRYLAFLEEEKRQQREAELLAELQKDAKGPLTLGNIEVISELGHDNIPAKETIVIASGPDTIQTKANFPSHKQNHRRR